jgi:hypothetical protein
VFINTCGLDWMRIGVLLMRVDFVEEFDFLIKLLGIHGLLENLLMANFTGRQ